MQVGALRALLEAGIQPDLWVGTSVGAINAVQVTIRGFSAESLAQLKQSWHDAAEADLLPASYLWLTVRTLFNRAGAGVEHRIRDFLIDHGLDPDLRFGQIEGPRLIMVSTDLMASGAALYGTDPEERVLEGVLASGAIPPWMRPLRQENRLLMDGGLVSNLPIEPAMTQGATEIVALDLADPRSVGPAARGMGHFVNQLIHTMELRQADVEMQLAEARGITVHRVILRPESPVAVWDFPKSPSLVEPGYQIMRRYLKEHPELAGS
jgi:NTE family protein